jgi:hypothetical protein
MVEAQGPQQFTEAPPPPSSMVDAEAPPTTTIMEAKPPLPPSIPPDPATNPLTLVVHGAVEASGGQRSTPAAVHVQFQRF